MNLLDRENKLPQSSSGGGGERGNEEIMKIIESYRGKKWALIPLLQEIQGQCGYVPPWTIRKIAEATKVFPAEVRGVVTFYAQFYTKPRGKYIVRVCKGTSCHVRGGRDILRTVKEILGISEGETTPDNLFSLEVVACLGTCFLSPAMMVGKDYYGLLSARRIPSILSLYKEREKK
jgi:NADH:ubiquinone oxidoreductase subunit E